MSDRVTFTKVQTGIFEVYLDGEKTKYEIHNGCLGLSGRDTRNIYGIYNRQTDSVKWIGPLRSCKNGLAYSLTKKVVTK